MSEDISRMMRVENRTENLRAVREFISEILDTTPFDRADRGKIILAIDEAVANIIEHGYEDGGSSGYIEVCVAVNPDRLEVVIRDHSEEFDPTAHRDPNVLDHIKFGKKKGLGMFIMRKIMDEVVYSFSEDHHNELRMVKFFCATAD